MPVSIQKVQPGALITSAFVNGLIDQLAALDGRVSKLEGLIPGNRVMQIFSPLPTDTYNMGTELRIVGQGFGFPSLNTVTFDGISPVSTFKSGSNDNLLILDIPTFPLPPAGKVVTLSVSNNVGFAQTSFTLLPPVATVPSGQLFLTQTAGPQQVVQSPGFDLFYTLSAAVTLADTYTLTSIFTGAVTGWDAFVADSQNGRLSPDIQIPAQSAVPVHVRVQVPAVGTGVTVGLTLNLASKNNPTTVRPVTTGVMQLTTGQPAPGAEKVGVTPRQVADSQGGFITPDSKGVYALPVARAPASFFFMVTAPPRAPAANYTAVGSLDQGATGWPASPVQVVDPPGGKLLGFQGQKQIQVNVTPQAGAQQTNVTVRVSLDTDVNGTFGHVTLPIRAA